MLGNFFRRTSREQAGKATATAGILGPLVDIFGELGEGLNVLLNLGHQGSFLYDAHHIVTSEDPNDIEAIPTGAGSAHWTTPRRVVYRIDFFNEPKANAPAFNVVVKLHLDPGLNPTTVQPESSSFPGTRFNYDPATRMVTWVLPNIDLTPDTKPPNGEAWVSFSASPKGGLKTGAAIHESAQVLFDFNPPIDTPSITRTIDATPPKVVMLKAGKLTRHILPLTWTVKSAAGAAYSELYVSINGKRLTPLAQTTKTSYQFPVQAGKRYSFAVQSIDVAGLTSPVPTRPVISIRVK